MHTSRQISRVVSLYETVPVFFEVFEDAERSVMNKVNFCSLHQIARTALSISSSCLEISIQKMQPLRQ